MAITTLSIDTSQLRTKIDAAKQASLDAKNEALATGMDIAVRFLIGNWPRDTNSSVVSWQNAANQAGLGPVPVDKIVPSREGAKIEKRLREQLDYWDVNVAALEGLAKKRLAEYAANPPKGKRGRRRKMNLPERWPSYRKSVKQQDRALSALAKFLEAGGRVVAIYGKSNKRNNDYLASTLTSVRTNLGIGEGRRFLSGGALIIALTNRSPHARIIDRRNRTVARARAQLRAQGFRTVGATYIRELARQADIALDLKWEAEYDRAQAARRSA